jgi:hypothetical protein
MDELIIQQFAYHFITRAKLSAAARCQRPGYSSRAFLEFEPEK